MNTCTDFISGLDLPEDEQARVFAMNARALGF